MASLTYRIVSRTRKSLIWLKGFFHVHVTLKIFKFFKKPIKDITTFQRFITFIERADYSQNGEDGIIHAIFKMIEPTNKFSVDFGAWDGKHMSNTYYLRKYKGWKGLMMDGEPYPGTEVRQEFITAENIEELFRKYEVPEKFDLLSIDIDGNDYWVWRAITHFVPRVVIIEYNACIPYEPAVTVPYKDDFIWDKTDYYGVSLSALVKLGKEKGYTLIGTDKNGVNAFFVLDELVAGNFELRSENELYHPARFKGKEGKRHPPDPQHRAWVNV